MSISPNDFFQENAGSDSESNSDEGQDYYQPISAVDRDEEDDTDHGEISMGSNGAQAFQSLPYQNPNFHGFQNGHIHAERGISNLDLSEDDDDDDDDDEETMDGASDLAISRAFREDENRRNAPLTPENAMRIRNAMHGISFEGIAPDWAHSVPVDRLIDQLRRLRQPSAQN